MGLVYWILMGLIAGAVAKLLTPGKDPGGCIITILIGIAGALVGGFLATLLGFGGLTGFDLRSLVISILGAVILLAIYRAMKK
jgi:uncharacterized membrane protein YeaQ/YmgE (transglycosylase-associated protein family)